MTELEKYRTDQPEACIRDLYAKHGKVWVDQTWVVWKPLLNRSLIRDLPLYFVSQNPAKHPLSVWEQHGGVVLQSYAPRPLRNDNPRTPALVLLECPLMLQPLSLKALHATKCIVARLPPTWILHERFIANRFPGEVQCREFHQRLMHQHQRVPDLEAEITKTLDHDITNVCPVSTDDFPGAERCGIALDILPDYGPMACWPVKLITRPYSGQDFQRTWDTLHDRAPEVRGWRLATERFFLETQFWRFRLTRMQRMGFVRLGPVLYFMSMRKDPEFHRAQQAHDAAMNRLRCVAREVTRWPRYPVEGIPGPLRARRERKWALSG